MAPEDAVTSPSTVRSTVSLKMSSGSYCPRADPMISSPSIVSPMITHSDNSATLPDLIVSALSSSLRA